MEVGSTLLAPFKAEFLSMPLLRRAVITCSVGDCFQEDRVLPSQSLPPSHFQSLIEIQGLSSHFVPFPYIVLSRSWLLYWTRATSFLEIPLLNKGIEVGCWIGESLSGRRSRMLDWWELPGKWLKGESYRGESIEVRIEPGRPFLSSLRVLHVIYLFIPCCRA